MERKIIMEEAERLLLQKHFTYRSTSVTEALLNTHPVSTIVDI
jgi:hypothetical protein